MSIEQLLQKKWQWDGGSEVKAKDWEGFTSLFVDSQECPKVLARVIGTQRGVVT